MADDNASIESVITSSLNEQFGNDWNTDSNDGEPEIVEVGSNTSADDTSADGDDGEVDDGDSTAAATDTATTDGDGEGDAAAEEDTDTEDKTKEKTPVVEDDRDDTDKELEALGIKKPKAGERENRLPYTRMKKIFGNAKKKWDEGVLQPALKEHKDKITTYEGQLERYNATNQLIATDPERFIRVLAHLNPQYKRFVDFLDSKGGETIAHTTVTDANDPRPEPDFTYDDGSKGFTPEGLAKREAWNTRQAVKQAVAEAKKEWEKDFGPIRQEREDARKYREQQQQRQQRVESQVSRARKVWGDKVLVEYKDAIIAKLNEDKTLDFGDAVAAVMHPILTKNRDTIHADVVKELQQRPGAAAKKVPAATGATKKDAADMSTEEVILESLRAQGLVK